MFIVLEGPDGSGKTDQVERLARRLRATANCEVLQLAFPTASPAGYAARKCMRARWQEVSDDPLFQAIVTQVAMTADRYGAVGQIRACLRADGIVVVERYWPSGIVYGAADGLAVEWIARIQAELPEADLYLLLDLSAAETVMRVRARGMIPERYENSSFQARVVAGYRRMWLEGEHRKDHSGIWQVVQADRAPDDVHAEIWSFTQAAHRRLFT